MLDEDWRTLLSNGRSIIKFIMIRGQSGILSSAYGRITVLCTQNGGYAIEYVTMSILEERQFIILMNHAIHAILKVNWVCTFISPTQMPHTKVYFST